MIEVRGASGSLREVVCAAAEMIRDAPLAYLASRVSFFRLYESSLLGQPGCRKRPLPDKLHKAEDLVML